MKLRFTIRDLLWLATLVAVCVAWWLHAQKHKAEMRQLETSMDVMDTHFSALEMQASVSRRGYNDPGVKRLFSKFQAELSELRTKIAELKD